MGTCCSTIQDQTLIPTLQKAFLHISFNCDEASLEEINKLVDRKSEVPLKLNKCTVQYQLPSVEDKRSQTREKPRLIIYLQQGSYQRRGRNLGPGGNSNAISPGKPGLLIYKQGYYIGNILNKKAEDLQGTMVFINPKKKEGDQAMRITIKGQWENGDLIRGKGYKNPQKQWFSLKWNTPGRDISLNFLEGDISSYNGLIKLDLTENLINILSGKATIIFSDGSSYKGRVEKGMMDTQQGENALFKSPLAQEIYLGPYRKGQRNGESLMIKTAYNTVCAFKMSWNEGMPDPNTFKVQTREYVQNRIQQTEMRP